MTVDNPCDLIQQQEKLFTTYKIDYFNNDELLQTTYQILIQKVCYVNRTSNGASDSNLGSITIKNF
jgi:hypothetical protein